MKSCLRRTVALPLLVSVVLPIAAIAATNPSKAKKPLPYLGLEFRWHQDRGPQRFLHVERVAPNGPAHKAGVQPDDLITHISGVRVDFGDELDFLMFMRDRNPGDRLLLTIIRAGRQVKVNATLGALPEFARPAWERGFEIARQKRAAGRARPR